MTKLLTLLALGAIKGIAQAGDEFAPAEHGLGDKDVAELLACGAAEVVLAVADAALANAPDSEAAEAAAEPAAGQTAPAGPDKQAAPARPGKPRQPAKGRAA